MSNKYFGGVVADKGAAEAVDEDLKAVVTGTYDKVAAKMEGWRVADAITDIFTLFKRCNKYIDETEPWVLAKDPAKADRLATVLYNLTESIVIGASLLEPYMPGTAEKIAPSSILPCAASKMARPSAAIYPGSQSYENRKSCSQDWM